MIPDFTASGSLPAGVISASWSEVVARFGTNKRRGELLKGLEDALCRLRDAGCSTVYLDGSFVTSKDHPGDFDVCWESSGVDFNVLDPVLLDFGHARAAQKARFKGELFPADTLEADSGKIFLDFFQRDRRGNPKGVVEIDLTTLP